MREKKQFVEARSVVTSVEGEGLKVNIDGKIETYSIKNTGITPQGWSERINKIAQSDPNKAVELLNQVASPGDGSKEDNILVGIQASA